MDECSCHVEDDECPNPREEQNQREGKKYKPHEQSPLWPAIISLSGESICSRSPRGHIPVNEDGRDAKESEVARDRQGRVVVYHHRICL
jgi:hypothetical protein